MSKAQNPYNSFYFHKCKYIGNTAHSIPNQILIRYKKEIMKCVITESEEKGIL